MISLLVSLLIIVLIVCLVSYVISLIPMDARARQIVYVILAVLVILWLLETLTGHRWAF